MNLSKKKRLAIHSVPRSGSSWLGSIFNSSPKVKYKYQPLFSYAFKNYLNDTSTKEDIINFFLSIAEFDDNFLNQIQNVQKGIHPFFHKNKNYKLIAYKEVRYHHLLENMLQQDKEIKIIGLVRNPFAVINSWLKAPREFNVNWEPLEEWQFAKLKNKNKKEEFYGFEKWKEVTYLFIRLENQYPDQFKLIKYDDLLKNTKAIISLLFEFVNLPLENQTLHYLDISRNKTIKGHYSLYKEKRIDDDWKEELDQTIINKIKQDLEGSILVNFSE